MIHLGKNTRSNIVSKSIAQNGGIANYRGTTRITKEAINSKATIKCDTIILDNESKVIHFPKISWRIILQFWNMKQQYQKLMKKSYFI